MLPVSLDITRTLGCLLPRRRVSRHHIHKNKDKFIDIGLWLWSRHLNYFGEIVLWIGVAIIALPILHRWQWQRSFPSFPSILLTHISGVPFLEARADEKLGGQTDYESYKARTSILFPMLPSNRRQ